MRQYGELHDTKTQKDFFPKTNGLQRMCSRQVDYNYHTCTLQLRTAESVASSEGDLPHEAGVVHMEKVGHQRRFWR